MVCCSAIVPRGPISTHSRPPARCRQFLPSGRFFGAAAPSRVEARQEKGGWTCPAAKPRRHTRGRDADWSRSSKSLLLLRFRFCLLGFLCHGV